MKMQIEPPMTYHFTSPKMAIIKKTDNKYHDDAEKLEPLYITGGNGKWCHRFGKESISFSKNKHRDSAIPLPDMHPREMKT